MVHAGQKATAESCAHCRCQRRWHPRLCAEFCSEAPQIHFCGQAPEFLQLQRPGPEVGLCMGLGHHFCWERHARKSACSHLPGQFVVPRYSACSSSRHSHLLSFDVQGARASMAEMHAEGRAAHSQSIVFWKKKVINWLRCNRWVRLINTDKNLGTALVETQWIED